MAARGHYLRQLFPEFRLLGHAIRAILPVAPGIAAVLGARALVGPRDLPVALLELAGFIAVTLITTLVAERRLIAEMFDYLRPQR